MIISHVLQRGQNLQPDSHDLSSSFFVVISQSTFNLFLNFVDWRDINYIPAIKIATDLFKGLTEE